MFSRPVFLVLFLFALSCKEDSGCPKVTNRTYELSAADKNQFPYNVNDTMSFVNNGKTVTFTGQARQMDFVARTVKRSVPAGCTEPVNSYETMRIGFLPNDTVFKKIDFTLQRAEQPTYDSKGVWTVTGNYVLNFTYHFAGIMSDTTYLDTVVVNGTLYKCVKIPSDTGDISNALYYNHNFGILRLNLPTNQVWNRK